jgi:siroheme synthase
MINRRLAEAARQGRNAVHLKGGDPFSFVRGAEIDGLRQAGITVVIVPGVAEIPHGAAAAALPSASEMTA